MVIGVDNYGDLDVVRIPLSSSFGGGGGYKDCGDDGTSENDIEYQPVDTTINIKVAAAVSNQ